MGTAAPQVCWARGSPRAREPVSRAPRRTSRLSVGDLVGREGMSESVCFPRVGCHLLLRVIVVSLLQGDAGAPGPKVRMSRPLSAGGALGKQTGEVSAGGDARAQTLTQKLPEGGRYQTSWSDGTGKQEE